jgi:rod shape determining protein RodA
MNSSRNNAAASINVKDIDRQLLSLYIALVTCGWVMIYAVNRDPADPYSFISLSTSQGKQLFFIVFCLALLFVIMMIDWVLWRTFSFIIYLGSMVLMLGTIFLGREVNGANAWYQIGGFTIQPGELAKFGTCLAMSAYLSSTSANMKIWKSRLTAFGIMLLPILIILLQKDTGSALVFFSFMLVLYREGLSASWYILGFGTAALVILGLIFDPPYVVAHLLLLVSAALISRFKERKNIWWGIWALLIPVVWYWQPLLQWLLSTSDGTPAVLPPNVDYWVLVPPFMLFIAAFFPNYLRKNNMIQSQLQFWALLLGLSAVLVFTANFACYKILAPHQQVRIKIWLRPWEITDTRGAAYNLLHSKMAIGSGGLTGKGLFEGNMTRLRFVPEQSTDFIFCTVGEEHGFAGTFAVIALFAWLLLRLTVMAERQRSAFSRLYIYCVTGVLFVHFIVNIGMTMGLFPIIGIPLPFVSYGGSSLIGFTLMIGLAMKLDLHRFQA